MKRYVRSFGTRTFSSMRHRNFRLFAIGQTISQTGTWMQMVATAVLVLQLTDDGVALGMATAAQFGPVLVLGAWAGVLCDRTDRYRLLVAVNVAGTVVASLFAVVVLSGAVELWSAYLLAALSGTVLALENPVRRAFVNNLVGETDLPNAIGLVSTVASASRIIGPAVAGGLITGLDVGWCMAANAVSFVPQLVLLVRMNRSAFRPIQAVAKAKGQLRDGVRYAWATPALRIPLLMLTVIGVLSLNHAVTLPLLADRDLGGGAGAYTVMYAAMSSGALLGTLLIARRSDASVAFLARGAVLYGLAMSVFSASPTLEIASAVAVVVGLTQIVVVAGAISSVQLEAAPQMQGRVLALLSVIFIGTTPLGGPIAGWVAEAFGARAALLVGGVASAAAGGVTLRAVRTPRAVPVSVSTLCVQEAGSVAS